MLVVPSHRFDQDDAIPAGSIGVARSLLECTETGLLCLDRAGGIRLANRAARRLLGLPATAAALSAAALSRADQARLVNLVGGDVAGPVQLATRDGLTLSVASRRAPDGAVLLSIEPIETAEPPMARADALTSLADRSLFTERLDALCATGHDVALLLIDLDRFKLVNDSLGHPAGDALLRHVAQRLRKTCREADVVSRFGGDEFAIALRGGAEAVALAERLVNALSRPYLVERQTAVIGASIGLAHAPAHGCDSSTLLRAADLALYQAKADGRGVVRVFTSELGNRARNRGALAEDLRRAIPLRELRLEFQPQLCLGTDRLIGFEALVRWPHPTRGLIPPDQFIPLAEDMGLIVQLGEWVLNEACRQAVTWPGELTVAVNVSPKQLADRERLPRSVAAALAATGLPPHRLEIEITESGMMGGAEALAVLRAIRAMGVRVSMDDFGTGYSSLSQLRQFPFDKLKIDRSFISDLGNSEEAAAVVRAIAALGRSLGMATVAEGVETPDQAAICRADGCSSVQGYLISRPVPAEAVDGVIASLRNPPPN